MSAAVRSNALDPVARGFAYIEVLIAVVLMTVSLVPAIESLGVGIVGIGVRSDILQVEYLLKSRLEAVLAEPFATLDAAATAAGSESTPTSYSDDPGTTNRVLVFLARYDGDDADADGDPFTGGDDGLLWLRVAIEASFHDVQTLTER